MHFPAREACPGNISVDMGTDCLGMRIAVDWDIKTQTIQKTTAYSLVFTHTHTHARTQFSKIDSSTLNRRRVIVLKRGVRQILKKMKLKKKKII